MKIGFDVDDVLADLIPVWLADYNRGTGDNIRLEQIDRWEMTQVVNYPERLFDYLTSEMYDRVPPIVGALAVVKQIRAMGHEVYFVSNCGVNNKFAIAKVLWLQRHGFLRPEDDPWKYFIPGIDKRFVDVDMLIDDNVKNVETFQKGLAVLLDHTHNCASDTKAPRLPSLGAFVHFVASFHGAPHLVHDRRYFPSPCKTS